MIRRRSVLAGLPWWFVVCVLFPVLCVTLGRLLFVR